MHPKLSQLTAYYDGELDVSEQQVVETHLAECSECHAAFEHFTTALKDSFATHRPTKSPDCPDEVHWQRYLSNEMSEKDQTRWKEHLRQCDYCFDVAASLTNETIEETVFSPLRPPEWLINHPEVAKVINPPPTLPRQIMNFINGRREAWTKLVTPPRWRYAAAVAAVMVVLLIGGVVWQQLTPTDSPLMVELPGVSVQLVENEPPYQLLTLSASWQSINRPASKSEWERWYGGLMSEGNSPKSVVAQLTAEFAEGIRILESSPQGSGLERLTAELKAQFITIPLRPIGAVLVEQALAEQLVQGTYKPNQSLRLTFLTTNETASTAQTILKIEIDR